MPTCLPAVSLISKPEPMMNAKPNSPKPRHSTPQEPANNPPSPDTDTGIENFLQLMRRELVEPLKEIADLAGRLCMTASPDDEHDNPLLARLRKASRRTRDIASRLIGIGELLSGDPIIADERVLLADSVRDAATAVAPLAREHGIGIRMDDSEQSLAPVYGSTHWLGMAMQCLLRHIIQSAPPRSHVLLRIRQVGFHQLVTAVIQFVQPNPKSLDLLKSSARSVGSPSVRSQLALASVAEDIDLALARAAIEAHGGNLRSEMDADQSMTQFTLTLPTGESHGLRQRPSCVDCPYVHQAEQFAQDIGELLNRPPLQSPQTPDRS